MTDSLTDAVRAAALDLPEVLVNQLAQSVHDEPGPTTAARSRAVAKNPSANYRRHATALFDAWAGTCPDLAGEGVAVALRAALAATKDLRDLQSVEIAWTGPATGLLVARATREALIEVIRSAKRSLICLSYAAYKNELIQDELAAAAKRGVEVMLILDTTADSKGALTMEARSAFEALEGAAAFYAWPGDLRPDVGSQKAKFHAKAIIADREVAFVTSANLTGAAINSNIELGLVVRGGPVPEQLETQIRSLIASDILRRVT